MGRAQQQRTNDINDANRNSHTEQYGNFNAHQTRIGDQNQTNANESFRGAADGYRNLSAGFGPGDSNYGSGGSGGRGGFSAHGYKAENYNPNTYDAKGYDADTYKSDSYDAKSYAAKGYNSEGYTGEGYKSTAPQYQLRGIDPNNLADAKTGYGEFAKTGGMDEAARGNFRLRGNAALPSFFSNMKNNMATRRNVQGGYGSGFDAADDQLARTAGQSTYMGALNTEGTLQDKINSGRQFGIGGQADTGKFSDDLQLRHDTTEGNFADAYANRQDAAGMFSAGARNRATEFSTGARNEASRFNTDAGNRASEFNTGAINRASEVNTGARNEASRVNSGARNNALQFNTDSANKSNQFNAGAKNDAGQFNANANNQASAFNASAGNSASAGNAGLDERAREFNADQDFQRRNAGAGGYAGLYGNSNSATAAANDRWLGGLGGSSGTNQKSIDSRFEYNKPWGENLANNLVGGAAGAAGAYFSGGTRRGSSQAGG